MRATINTRSTNDAERNCQARRQVKDVLLGAVFLVFGVITAQLLSKTPLLKTLAKHLQKKWEISEAALLLKILLALSIAGSAMSISFFLSWRKGRRNQLKQGGDCNR